MKRNMNLRVLAHALALAAVATSAGCALEPMSEEEIARLEDDLQANQVYTFRNVFNNKCLDIAGNSTADGGNLQLWDCSGADNQKFTVVPISGEWVSLRSVRSGKCLDVWGRSTEPGANIAQYTCNGGTNQQFRVDDVASGGVVRVVSRLSGQALDAWGWGTTNGTNVAQWTVTGGDNQKFTATLVSGGSTGGGSGGGSSSCTTPPPASPLVGWATVSGTTTGGGNATPQTVTTFADLQNAVSGTTPRVVYVRGNLGPGKLRIGSNKTIVGLCGAEIRGAITLSGSSNVIIRNLKLTGYAVGNCALDPDYNSSVGCSSGNDAVSVTNDSHHIWFDHCHVSNGTDGNLDINNGSNYITVSWTKFSYAPRTDTQGSDSTGAAGHRYSNLVGGSDSRTSDRGKLNVTWHHNWWADNVVERQARVRYGKNHFFNNVWNSTASSYCIRAGREASIYADNNYFRGVKDAHEFNSSTDRNTAFITVVNNTYDATSGVRETGGGGTAFNPSSFYSYSATNAATAYSQVLASAGPQ
jgi:pectate lyase